MIENKIQKLTDIEHLLLRPNMYIGSIQYTETNGFLFNTETSKFEYKLYSFIPGIIKIVMEVLDNAIDEYIRTNGKHSNKIDIIVEDSTIKIQDNGRGVPVDIVENLKISQLELAFTHAKAGSNFNDEDRQTLGMNGFGAFCTNVFSKYFKITSQTPSKKGVLICEDNLSKKSCKITNNNSPRTGTIVEFTPDFKKFNIEKFDDVHKNLIYQRLIHLAVCYPNIQFKFNGTTLKFNTIEKYFNYFSSDYCCIEEKNYAIAIMPNDSDDFRFSSYINGLNISGGGNHIDIINNEIISRLRENKIFKKYKITPGDVRNKIQLVVIMREFPKMEFDSQSKEKLTNSPAAIKQYFDSIDWDHFVKDIAKKDSIIDPILINYKLKEELKNRLALKNMEKTDDKEIRCEKYFPSTGEKKYLAICEGDSAFGSLSSALGRDKIGYFAARGVPLNAYTANTAKFTANKELTNIVKVLGISLKKDADQDITYKNILISTDADADGNRITALFLGFFQRYCPQLLIDKKIKKLRTPIITINSSKGEILKMFFKLSEYHEYEKHNQMPHGSSIRYYKGLGTWRKELLQKLIQKHGLEYFIEDIDVGDDSVKAIDDWIGDTPTNCESRKEYLRHFEVNIELT